MFIFFGGLFVRYKKELTLDATTTILTEEGDVFGKLYEENRVPVKIEDIPEHVLDAYIAIEDRRFYHHQGIDYRSIFRAIYRDIIARSKVEGGRSEEHTSELQSRFDLVCRLLLEKKNCISTCM